MGHKAVAPLLDRLPPSPGEGPSEQARRAGRFAMDIHTRMSNGTRYLARVAASADPGYNASSLMLGESTLCLALDSERLPPRGGVLTPATTMSMTLVERLRNAGLTLTTEKEPEPSPDRSQRATAGSARPQETLTPHPRFTDRI